MLHFPARIMLRCPLIHLRPRLARSHATLHVLCVKWRIVRTTMYRLSRKVKAMSPMDLWARNLLSSPHRIHRCSDSVLRKLDCFRVNCCDAHQAVHLEQNILQPLLSSKGRYEE